MKFLVPYLSLLLAQFSGTFGDQAFLGQALPSGPVAVGFNSITSRALTTDATSYATLASYTPTANAVVLVAVVNSKASAPDTPTFSGNGMTWTRIVTTNFNTIASPTERLTLFYGTTNAPQNGTGTADFAGATQTGCSIMIVEFPNANTSAPFAQTNITSADATTTLSVTLGTTLNANNLNAIYCCMGNNKIPFGSIVNSNSPWLGNKDFDTGYASPNTGSFAGHVLTTTNNNCFVTNSVNSAWAAIAVEVKSQ